MEKSTDNSKTLAWLNSLPADQAIAEFRVYCASTAWASLLNQQRPFLNLEALLQAAKQAWCGLKTEDWLHAFQGHAKIGKLKKTEKKSLGQQEQAAVQHADAEILMELAKLNQQYIQKHGFLFLVFATGKSAIQMLEILKQRIGNSTAQELQQASEEQIKIFEHRFKQFFNE